LGIEHHPGAPEMTLRNALNNILIFRILASRFFKTRDLGQNLSPNAHKAGDLLENTLAGSGRGGTGAQYVQPVRAPSAVKKSQPRQESRARSAPTEH
jgi:hypothetical protein